MADPGCGPGGVTARPAGFGLSVFGLDLSESMLAVARRENPGLRFVAGSMLDLDLADGALDGVLCRYSSIHTPDDSIHTPDDRLLALFGEFRRVLRPGGRLLPAFRAGDTDRRLTDPWGHPVALDFRRRQPETMAAPPARAGFTLHSRTVREADADLGESSPQAFLPATA